MKLYILFHLVILSNISFCQNAYRLRTPDELEKVVEISSIAWVNDSLYLPAAKCGQIYKLPVCTTDCKREGTVILVPKRNTEGIAYCNGSFYLSDDDSKFVYRYNSDFTKFDSFLINLRTSDIGIIDNAGFEGIAVVKDSILFLLLEKATRANQILHNSVLYECRLRQNNVEIIDKHILEEDKDTRYCDLLYMSDTLFLLRSTFISRNNPGNKYEIHYLLTDYNYNIYKVKPSLTTQFLKSVTQDVRRYSTEYDTNVEGLGRDSEGNFYIVTDNDNNNTRCLSPSEKRTLLLKVNR